jgi:hypothetical protein
MKRLVLAWLLATTTGLIAAEPLDGVREAAAGWRAGAVKQDEAALKRWLADDLVYTHGGGKTQTKAEYIADVTKGSSHYDSFKESGTKIRLYGKTAVLTGFVEVTPAKGEPYRVRTLEIYVENGGRWQMAQKESVRAPK